MKKVKIKTLSNKCTHSYKQKTQLFGYIPHKFITTQPRVLVTYLTEKTNNNNKCGDKSLILYKLREVFCFSLNYKILTYFTYITQANLLKSY